MNNVEGKLSAIYHLLSPSPPCDDIWRYQRFLGLRSSSCSLRGREHGSCLVLERSLSASIYLKFDVMMAVAGVAGVILEGRPSALQT